MRGLSQIHQINRDRAIRTAKEKSQPFIVEQQDIEDWRRVTSFPFPNVGDYRHKDFELDNTIVVTIVVVNVDWADPSPKGPFGNETIQPEELPDRLEVGKGYAVIKVTDQEVHVGVFSKKPIRTPNKPVRRHQVFPGVVAAP